MVWDLGVFHVNGRMGLEGIYQSTIPSMEPEVFLREYSSNMSLVCIEDPVEFRSWEVIWVVKTLGPKRYNGTRSHSW